MKKQVASSESKGLKTFFLYFAVVFLCIVISLAIKLFYLFQESKFDGEQNFTVAVSKNGRVEEVIMVDPKGQILSVLQLEGEAVAYSALGKKLGIGVYGNIEIPSSLSLEEDITKQLFTFFWQYTRLKTNLTIIDMIRMALFSQGIKTGNRTVEDVTFPSETTKIDKQVTSLFTDDTLSSEQTSIQIINTSDIPGLGGRLERVLLNMGANVVAVSTSQKKETSSKIQYSGEETYTVRKIGKLLGFPLVKNEKQNIAEITIILGEDSLRTKKF